MLHLALGVDFSWHLPKSFTRTLCSIERNSLHNRTPHSGGLVTSKQVVKQSKGRCMLEHADGLNNTLVRILKLFLANQEMRQSKTGREMCSMTKTNIQEALDKPQRWINAHAALQFSQPCSDTKDEKTALIQREFFLSSRFLWPPAECLAPRRALVNENGQEWPHLHSSFHGLSWLSLSTSLMNKKASHLCADI